MHHYSLKILCFFFETSIFNMKDKIMLYILFTGVKIEIIRYLEANIYAAKAILIMHIATSCITFKLSITDSYILTTKEGLLRRGVSGA